MGFLTAAHILASLSVSHVHLRHLRNPSTASVIRAGKSWWFKYLVLSMAGSSQPGKRRQDLESGTGHALANQCDFHLIKASLRTPSVHLHLSYGTYPWQTNMGSLCLSPWAGQKF